jgi:hypothetical protein
MKRREIADIPASGIEQEVARAEALAIEWTFIIMHS